MPVFVPVVAGATLFAAPYLYQKASEASNALRKIRKGEEDNNEELVAENNENEKEGGQRNFGDDYKQQELYYASDEYKETLEPYEKSSSGNNVNSDNAARSKKLTEEVKEQNRKRLSKYNQRRQGGVLRYPLESLTEHTDYLQIDIEKYVPIGSGYASAPGEANRYVTGNYFTTNRAGRRSASKLSTKPLINAGTILLPIPASLQDTNNVRYDSSNLNGLAAAGVELAESGMRAIDFTKPVQQQADALRDTAGVFKDRVQGGVGSPNAAKDIIIKSLASAAVNQFGANTNFNQLLARSTGEILNPNMELLFGGPTLRNFRFQFKFTPRNEKEAEQVRLIIRAFKRNMALKSTNY